MKTYEEICEEVVQEKVNKSFDYATWHFSGTGLALLLKEIAKRYACEALKENTPSLDDVNKMFAEKHPEYNTRSRLHTIDLVEVNDLDMTGDFVFLSEMFEFTEWAGEQTIWRKTKKVWVSNIWDQSIPGYPTKNTSELYELFKHRNK